MSETTAEERLGRRRRRERGSRPLRWIKKGLKRVFTALALLVLPRIYVIWMWFLYKTSKVEHLGCYPGMLREKGGQGVYAIWHDEVVFVAYAFGRWNPDTLASHGAGGELIAKMLRLCGFNVFRGGSSRGRKRRAGGVLRDMIDHMKANQGILYGITTDGSHGPPYRMKSGAVAVAVRSAAPMAVEKSWCKRYIRLRTWDRTIIPLPFNHIVHAYMGPFIPPRDVFRPGVFEEFCKKIEHQLCRVTVFARHRAEGSAPDQWIDEFPEHCREQLREELPRIADLELVLPFEAVVIDDLPEGSEDTLPGAPNAAAAEAVGDR